MTWYSQAGQDAWVHGILGDGGFFVDVGAYDGIEHSNTYALETEYGWTGYCIEPQRDIFDALCHNRPGSICLLAAAGDRTGHGAMLGDRFVGDPKGGVLVDTLTELIGTNGATTGIDYLSIDTEGMDLAVLQGHDFDEWPVRLITVEHNLYRDGPAHKDAIHAYLTDVGFERVVEDVVAPGYGQYEDWYRARRRGVTLG